MKITEADVVWVRNRGNISEPTKVLEPNIGTAKCISHDIEGAVP